MGDFAKTMIAVLLTAAISTFATTAKLDAGMVNIEKSIDRIEQKLEQFDERVRRVEIKQAYFEAKFIKLQQTD